MSANPGSLASQAPQYPGTFQSRKNRDAERQAQEQAAARTGQALQIGAGGILIDGGSLTITGSGTLNVGTGALNSAGSITAATSLNANSLAIIANATIGGTLGVGGTLSAPALSCSGTVSGAQGTFASGLSSPGAYTTDVSALPGARQTVWQHNSGVYGFAPSSIATKMNLGPVPFTAADVRAVSPYVFQYKSQLAIRDDPENSFYDPTYQPPWEIGLMAEHLIEHNMSCFVFYEEDGTTPKGINYDLFGAIAPLVVLADQEARLAALEAKA